MIKNVLRMGFLVALFSSATIMAQEDEMDTYGFGNLNLHIKPMNDKTLSYFSYYGAYHITKKWALGGGGAYSVGGRIPIADTGVDIKRWGYGGFLAEYQIPLANKLQLNIQSLLGFGGYGEHTKGSGFWLIEPGITLAYGLSKHAKIDMGIRYLYTVKGIEPIKEFHQQMNRPSLSLGLRFGNFR